MNNFNQAELKIPCIFSAAIFVLALLPFFLNLMTWVSILSVCAIIVCIMRAYSPIPTLSHSTINLFSIFCLALLILFYFDFGLLDTMINLLVVACSLKFLMMRNRMDFHLLILVFMFLIAAGFIYHHTIFIAIYYGVCVFLVFLLAFMLNSGRLSVTSSAIQSAKLLLQSLPIALLIFLIAPRLPPFWQIPKGESTETGLAESMAPGDIANLAKSKELVFRADFTGDLPSNEQLYWRAVVLDHFDGITWTINKEVESERSAVINDFTGQHWQYLINAEPGQTKWLYSLDVPQLIENFGSERIYTNHKFQLFNLKRNEQRQIYSLASYYEMPLMHASGASNILHYLQLPDDGNPKTREWVANQSLEGLSVNQILYQLSSKFVQESFGYTLQPPLMQSDPIDQFLFQFRRGFCSHYASAMTYILRLAGVPSRIVAGYQGGEYQADTIVTVRQYDAHAWIEAWDPELGWIRFDPTALVAPDRLTAGLLSSIRESEQALIEGNQMIRTLSDVALIKLLEDFMVRVNHNWSKFVLGYDQKNQMDIIERIFGDANMKNLVTFLFIAFTVVAIYLVTSFVPWRRWLFSKPVPSEFILLEFLKKKGWSRHNQETIQQFFKRIQVNMTKESVQALNEFSAAFYANRYGKIDNQKELNRKLKICLKEIKTVQH